MKLILTLLIVTLLLYGCNEDTNQLIGQKIPLGQRTVAQEYRIDSDIGKYVKCYSKLAGKTQRTYELESEQVLKLVPGSTIIEYKNDVWLHVSPKGYNNTCYVKTSFLEPVPDY